MIIYFVPTLQVVAASSTNSELFKSEEKETVPSKSSPTSGYAENREVLGENIREKEEEEVEDKESTEETDVKVPNQIPPNKSDGRRYPRRNISKKQYFEDSLPNDDDYMCE